MISEIMFLHNPRENKRKKNDHEVDYLRRRHHHRDRYHFMRVSLSVCGCGCNDVIQKTCLLENVAPFHSNFLNLCQSQKQLLCQIIGIMVGHIDAQGRPAREGDEISDWRAGEGQMAIWRGG